MVLGSFITFLLGQQLAKQPPLIEAFQQKDIARAKDLLHHGASPNCWQIDVTKPDLGENDPGGKEFKGPSLLEMAAQAESVEWVRMLLQCKAKPNLQSAYGWTPLMAACQRRNLSIVQLLLKYKANPEIENTYGDTALIFAANMDSLPIVKELHKYGAKLRGGSSAGTLHVAIQSGAKSVVSYLLKHGVDPNFHLPDYPTPLEAARSPYTYDDQIEKMLIKAGAKGKSRKAIEAESEKETKEGEQTRVKEAGQAKQVAETVTPTDLSVIESALLDFADEMKKQDRSENENLAVINETYSYQGDYEDDQLNAELDETQAMAINLELRKSHWMRNKLGVSLKNLQFVDSRLKLVDPDILGHASKFEFRKKVNAENWVDISLPGYSKDESRAFLRFSFGPTAHGAMCTTYLEKVAGTWKVRWHRIAFYA